MSCTTLAALGMPNFQPLCFWKLVLSLTMILRWSGWIKKYFVYTSSLSDQGINLRNISLKCSHFSIIKALKLWSQIITKLSCRNSMISLDKKSDMRWPEYFFGQKDLLIYVLDFLGFLDDVLFMGNKFLFLRLLFSFTNFCLTVQDVCYLTVLSLHVLALWALCSKLGLWSFKHEFSWCIWISNCELYRIIS